MLTNHDYSAIMRTALAYSAIDDGPTTARPFGDTGIKALYNDANDLGKIINLSNLSPSLSIRADAISKAFVQFAGELALNKVLNSASTAPALNGVLAVTDTNHSLTVDLSDATWLKAGSAAQAATARNGMIDALLNETGMATVMHTQTGTLWGDNTDAVFERVVFAALDTGSYTIADSVTGTGKADIFVGGLGADTVRGSAGNDLILGGAGNDTLSGGLGKDIVYGGAGNDYFYGNVTAAGVDGDLYDGGAGNDIQTYYMAAPGAPYATVGITVTMTGTTGTVQAWNGSAVVGTAKDTLTNIEIIYGTQNDDRFAGGDAHTTFIGGAGSDTYVLNAGGGQATIVETPSLGTDVIVAAGMRPENTHGVQDVTGIWVTPDAPGGIGPFFIPKDIEMVDPGTGEKIAASLYADKSWINLVEDSVMWLRASRPSSPLVLDLNNDGISLTAMHGPGAVYWDIDRDGFAEKSGWVAGGDGLLALDRNGNGKIDDNGELFGNGYYASSPTTDAADVKLYANGFASLAVLDTNHDNHISAADTQFGSLRVWVDANADGISQAAELKTLASLGITDINLAFTTPYTTIAGNTIGQSGTFTMNGATQTIVDAWFNFDNVDSHYTGAYTLAPQAAALPDLRGYGTLKDLHIAMSQDAAMLANVQNYVNKHYTVYNDDSAAAKADFNAVLFGWAASTSSSYGTKINFLDRLLGITTDPDSRSGFRGTADYPYDYAADQLMQRLIVQTSAGDAIFTAKPVYNVATDTFSGAYTVNTAAIQAAITAFAATDVNRLLTAAHAFHAIEVTAGFDHLSTADQTSLTTMIQSALGYFGATLSMVESSVYGDLVTFDDQTASSARTHDNLLIGDGGDNSLYAGAGNDYLVGGAGQDSFQGGTGDDTYFFKPGDGPAGGADWIIENVNEGVDTIRLGGGVLPSDVKMWQDHSYIYLQYSATDKIAFPAGTMSSGINPDSADPVNLSIERVVFDNGTVWDFRNGMSMTDTDDANFLLGTAQNDTLDGRGGNDTIYGFAGNDTLIGGTGSDTLQGGLGDDTYVFRVGDSPIATQDNIYESANAGVDTIKLTGGILPANVTMWTDGNTIDIKYSATDQLSFYNAPDANGNVVPTFEKIAFDNGTVWDLRNGLTLTGTAGDDQINGFSSNDIINGNAGNDTISGNAGNDAITGGTGQDNLYGGTGDDTYVFKAGDSLIAAPDNVQDNIGEGIDTIKLTGGILPANVKMWTDYSGAHILYTANDMINVQSGSDSTGSTLSGNIEKIVFDNGTIWDLRNGLPMTDTDDGHQIIGSAQSDVIDGRGGDDNIQAYAGNDTITGGTGADYLYGGTGDDTFIVKKGDSLTATPDYIYEYMNEGVDTLKLTGGILPTNVHLSTTPGMLTVQYSATDTINIQGDYDSTTNSLTPGVEKIAFDNGTVWDFRNGITTSDSSTGNEVHGTMLKDIINGNGGDDILYGEGNNDILNGGAGNDTLYGGYGDDQYVYSAGGGQGSDIIRDDSGMADSITLGTGYTAVNISLVRVGQYDLAINSGGQQLFLIQGQFDSSGSIESLKYGDGTTLNLMTYSHTVNGTAADDSIYGTSYGAGGDKLNGLDGNDYIYAGSGDDIVTGGNGNDTIYGDDGNDTLSGNAGDDTVNGGLGNDTVIYDSGADIFSDNGGTDIISITTAGLTAANMTLVRPAGNSSDLEVLLNGVHAFNIQGQFNQDQGFETIKFTNGTTFNLSGVQYTGNGTSGDDYLYGISFGGNPNDIIKGNAGNDYVWAYQGNDTITGGTGNDVLDGGDGNDTYIYNVGDGADTITDSSGTDLIQLGAGFVKADLTWARDVGTNNMILSLKGVQVMTLIDQFTADHQIEAVKFSDGTTQTLVGLQIATNGTAGDDYLSGIQTNASQDDNIKGLGGNDYIYGYEGSDILAGGTGNNYIDGGNGNDTYVYNAGDGIDTITDSSGNDVIQVGAGFTAANLTWARVAGTNDLALSLKGVLAMTVQNHFTDGYAVETVKFLDGTSYALTSLALTTNGTAGSDYLSGTSVTNDTINGLAGDDTINAYAGNDILTGGTGTDYISGGLGDDTYIFKTGESLIAAPDNVYEALNEGTDTIKLTGGILPTNVLMWTDQNALHIRYSATDEITVQAGYDPATGASAVGNYLEKIVFDNGTVWDLRTGLSMNDTNDSHYIYGSTQNDVIDAKGGDDNIYGFAGNDTLTGGTGIDTMSGGLGDDTYVFKAGDSAVAGSPDTVYENIGEGVDTIKLTGGILPANVLMWTDSSALHIQYSTNDLITVQAGYDPTTGASLASSYVEKIAFDNGTLWDLRNGFNMTDTNDGHQIYGSSQNDAIDGKGGDDYLYGFGGNDLLTGGAGNDYIDGGIGVDTASFAQALGAVIADLSAGTATGDGSDRLVNIENLTGSDYNDVLTGDTNANVLNGGAGNDVLYGNGGADILIGGLGADAFVFKTATAFIAVQTITDFNTAQGDKLDLSNIVEPFNPVTQAITDFVQMTTSGTNTIVSIDTDGAGTAHGWQQIATLTGVAGLTDEAALVANGSLII